MNPRDVLRILEGLAVLPFFVHNEHTMNSLVKLCGSMCSSLAEVQWLVNRMTSGIYTQWPGPAEMRACFCCRYKPKDGVNAYSSVYPDGLPVDPTAPPRPEIGAPSSLSLPPGHAATVDRQIDSGIQAVAQLRDTNRAVRRFNTRERQAPTNPNYRPITQAEIDRAVQENRDRRAREESGL